MTAITAQLVQGQTLVLGAEVTCTDGVCGDLRRLVLDPVAHVLTHLVVQPRHDRHGGRLVPISLLVTLAGPLALACTTAAFEELETAQESEFIQPEGGLSEHATPALLWPYYALGTGGLGAMTFSTSAPARSASDPVVITYDRVPLGEVEVRRHQDVLASDGTIGNVRGLVLDPHDHQVTHLLLAKGHVFGHRDVAIPIAAVSAVSERVQLTLSKDEVRRLPLVTLA
jgi:sporulation protein YlmC with PRC-barrel domain